GRAIPPELDRLCAHATRIDPEQRLASARELAQAIEAYLDGDRDLALRRDMAARHAAAAREALARSREPGADEAGERGRAMREITTSLGLDPQDREALKILVQLLAEPPRTMPRAAAESMRESALGSFRV